MKMFHKDKQKSLVRCNKMDVCTATCFSFLPLDATRSAVTSQYVVYLSRRFHTGWNTSKII